MPQIGGLSASLERSLVAGPTVIQQLHVSPRRWASQWPPCRGRRTRTVASTAWVPQHRSGPKQPEVLESDSCRSHLVRL